MGWTTMSGHLVRLRVPLSWGLGLIALVLARPTPALFGAGLTVAALGELLRTWAAGHLLKGSGLTRSGPYSWTRNPLYLGNSLIGLGFAVASARWELLLAVFALLVGVYLPVIRTEVRHLSSTHPELYAEYARVVPLLLPRPFNRSPWSSERRFSWKRMRMNREDLTWAGWLGGAALLWWKMV
jgi:protein-S-isoprenylcysteine O-methyltransferase Ste14